MRSVPWSAWIILTKYASNITVKIRPQSLSHSRGSIPGQSRYAKDAHLSPTRLHRQQPWDHCHCCCLRHHPSSNICALFGQSSEGQLHLGDQECWGTRDLTWGIRIAWETDKLTWGITSVGKTKIENTSGSSDVYKFNIFSKNYSWTNSGSVRSELTSASSRCF
jgi:hypothetical protein